MGYDLKPSVRLHLRVHEISCEKVHKRHIDEDACGSRVKDSLHYQSRWARLVVRIRDSHSNRYSDRCGHREKYRHYCNRHTVEISLQVYIYILINQMVLVSFVGKLTYVVCLNNQMV